MPWNWCGCCKPEREDVRELDYQHLGLKEVPVNVFVHERTLEELNLESNRVTELPRALFHCHGLRILNLSDNDISVVPPAIASLINLEHLNLSKNSLSDIPDNIKCCKQLVHINLSVNPLEKLPDGFTQLIALEEVYLNDTFLEFLPANFGRLSKLKVLDLRENNLNTLPKSIARLCNLQVLDIGKNEFSDLPEVVGNLPVLMELWADYNRVRCIPQFIGNLTQLTHLDLSNNNVNWIAGDIEKCIHLYFLALTGNELQNIPDEIGNLKELSLLKIDDNDIASLPTTLGKLTNLNELVASQNILEALPTNIGLLRKLEVLNVDDNRLSTLPSELGSCSSLRILSVRNNCLEMFPAELGHLTSIRVINVADNFLVNLPVSILKLHQLTALWLSTNQATPLTTLQQEIDPITGQMICVNFMFPQVDQERNLDELTGGRDIGVGPVEMERPARPRIRFADNTELLHPSRLTRAPTPYPKELRTMAKHARILATQPRSPSCVDENMPLLDEMQVGTASPVTIKVATVTKPSITSLVDPVPKTYANMSLKQEHGDNTWSAQDPMSMERTPNLPDVLDLNKIHAFESDDECVPLSVNKPSSDDYDVMPLLPSGDHVINGHFHQCKDSFTTTREDERHIKENGKPDTDFESASKTTEEEANSSPIKMKRGLQQGSVNAVYKVEQPGSNIVSDTVLSAEEFKSKDISAAKQPPPYHIAAAYSKQAAYFNAPSPYTPDIGVSAMTSSSPHELQASEVLSATFQDCEEQKDVGQLSSDSIDSQYIRKHVVEEKKVEHKSSDESSPQLYIQSSKATFVENTLLKGFLDQNSDGDLILQPSIVQSTINEMSSKPLMEHEVPKETLLNSHTETTIKEIASENSSLNTSWENKSAEESMSTKPSTTIPVRTSLPEKPLSKIPSLKSKLPQQVNKPTPQTRMLQPGFYVGRQHTVPSSSSPTNSGPTSLEDNKTDASIDSNLNVSYRGPPVFFSKIPTVKVSRTETVDSTHSNVTSPESPTSSSWVFGQHKNPTVFPVIIKKNPGLGFTIADGATMAGLPDKQETGIFIAKVNPNGPAANSLISKDKILEVDGIDFSKLDQEKAMAILKQTKRVVNMMVSRQK